MSHRIQLCETWVRCNVLLKFGTLEYHVRNKALTQPQLLTYLFFFSFFFLIGFQFCFLFFQVWVSLFSFFCHFFLSFVRVMWDGRPQLLIYLFFFFFFLIVKTQANCFLIRFQFCFLFFQVWVSLFSFFCQGHVGWEVTIVDLFIYFFSLFKHRQIVLSQGTVLS